MKVELTHEGKYVLVAESNQDNTLLFSLVNAENLNGVRFEFPQAKVREEKPKGFSLPNLFKKSETIKEPIQNLKKNGEPRKPYTKRKPVAEVKTRRKAYSKSCPVEGCEQHARGLSLHLKMKHGVQKDGSVLDTFKWDNEQRPVTEPVVQMPNGNYKLRKQESNLLG